MAVRFWFDRIGAPRQARGFTLIELVLVMTIIGMLLTLAVPRYFHALDNGRASVQRQNIAAMRDAIDKFHGDQGRYPDALEELVAKRYLREVPVDPVTEQRRWTIIAPPDSTHGSVYDVSPPPRPAASANESGG